MLRLGQHDRRPATRLAATSAACVLAVACWLPAVQAQAPTIRAAKAELPKPADAKTAPPAREKTRKPADYSSDHFLLHTDLDAKEARALLGQLENMLGLIVKYWQHPPVGIYECYVVKDLAVWPAESLHPAGRAKIEQRAGITMVESLSVGGKPVAAKAVVYSTSEHGSPQHEAVHAYCGQTFGRMGPLWYSEGMAEMGQYWRKDDTSVRCHAFILDYLRRSPIKSLASILSDQDAGTTNNSWQSYAWRWALCHMLENNPNYSARFRMLGLGYLNGQQVTFPETFGSMLEEIAFEYRFFLKHVDQGYRVDLCSWDWNKKFRELAGGATVSARVVSARGWQPSGVTVAAGTSYGLSASGTWQTSKESGAITANGKLNGSGRLEGVVLSDFTLSEPFALSAYTTFTPPAGGRLYLRCKDNWSELADNKGAMSVKIKRADVGAPLAKPTKAAETAAPPTPSDE